MWCAVWVILCGVGFLCGVSFLGVLGFGVGCGLWCVVCGVGLWCVVCGVGGCLERIIWGWLQKLKGSLGELHAILAYVGKYVE